MKTVTVQIGNSDNKLTQKQWSSFIFHVNSDVTKYASSIHFKGGSSYNEPWQNACWVFEMSAEDIPQLKKSLTIIRRVYLQDSVAITVGETEFI